MLHNFLRSLGRRSRTTKRASRRKFSPHTRRSDAAIERLEERMLLSGTTVGEPDTATLDPSENTRPIAVSSLVVWSTFSDQFRISDFLTASDSDGDSLHYEIMSPPETGTLQVGNSVGGFGGTIRWNFSIDGSCDFAALEAKGYIADSLTYRVFDGHEYSDVATINIYIMPDHLPTVEDQTYTGAQDKAVVGKLRGQDPDLDFLFYEVKNPPAVGGVLLIDKTTGDFVYTPPKGFAGTVSFTYSVREYWGEPPIAPATVTITIEPAANPVHGNPHQDKPHQDKPHHDNPHQDHPPVEKPSEHPATQPHSHTIESSDDHPQASSGSVAPAPADSHDGNGEGKALAGSEVLQVATIILPPTSSPNDVQPAKITTVIYASDELKVSRSLAHSLRLTRHGEGGLDEADVAKPVSYEYRDVNGDGREDLIAVFKLDWTGLWDGQESAVLSGRLS